LPERLAKRKIKKRDRRRNLPTLDLNAEDKASNRRVFKVVNRVK